MHDRIVVPKHLPRSVSIVNPAAIVQVVAQSLERALAALAAHGADDPAVFVLWEEVRRSLYACWALDHQGHQSGEVRNQGLGLLRLSRRVRGPLPHDEPLTPPRPPRLLLRDLVTTPENDS